MDCTSSRSHETGSGLQSIANCLRPPNGEYAETFHELPETLRSYSTQFVLDFQKGKCIDSLLTTMFSILDGNSSHWKIAIAKEDTGKSRISSCHDILQFLRMPFGLKNAPETFQGEMYFILSIDIWQLVLAYPDNSVIILKVSEVHIDQLRKVLTPLCNADVTTRLKMWEFFSNTSSYLVTPFSLDNLHITT